MFILKVIILINNQLLSTANAKDINTDCYCSDFHNESSGILVLGVVFSSDKFLTSLFSLAIFGGIFYIQSFVVLSLNLERNSSCDHFSYFMGV